MCSILYSGEKETAVEVLCLHYNQVQRHGDVGCPSILVSLVSSKVMNITYMTILLPITGLVSISQQREEKSGFVHLVTILNEAVLLHQHNVYNTVITAFNCIVYIIINSSTR